MVPDSFSRTMAAAGRSRETRVMTLKSSMRPVNHEPFWLGLYRTRGFTSRRGRSGGASRRPRRRLNSAAKVWVIWSANPRASREVLERVPSVMTWMEAWFFSRKRFGKAVGDDHHQGDAAVIQDSRQFGIGGEVAGDPEVGQAEFFRQLDGPLGAVPVKDGGGVIFDLDVKAGAGQVDFQGEDVEDDIDEGAVPPELEIFLAQEGAEAGQGRF